MRLDRQPALQLIALALAGACDSPRVPGRDPISRALAMREAQVFHALPPEAPTTRLVRRDAAPARPRRVPPARADSAVPDAPTSPHRPTVAVRDTVLALDAGESAPLAADVRDAGGYVVDHAVPRWRSLDPRVAEVVGGAVVARRPGSATLLAEWEGALTAVEVRVRRVLRLRVTDIDGVPVRAAIVVHAAARTDSLTASAAGRVHLREQLPEAGSIAVDVRGADGDATRPARLTLDVGTMGADAGVVLLPSRWRVAGGRHDGIEVPVDPRDATRDRAGSFVRLADDPRVGERVVGWSRTRLPIRVAAGAGITDGDTARFWATARDVERDLGMRLFAAAPAGDTSAGLRIRVAGGVRGAAVTQLSWTGGGEVMDAELLLRASSVLHDRRVVAHELVHALGFGHTDAWPSIVAPAGSTGAAWLTPSDVAWIQLAYRLRATQERLGAAHGLDAALAASDR